MDWSLGNWRAIYRIRINRDLVGRIIVKTSKSEVKDLLESPFSNPMSIDCTNSGLKGRKVSCQLWESSDYP